MQWFALALSTRLPSHFGMLPAVHKPTFRTPTNRRPLCARWCVLFWTGTAHPENNLKLHTRPSRSQTEKTWNLSELVARPRGHGIKSSKVSKVAPKYTHSQELHILEVVYDMHISSSCWVYVLGRLFAHMCMINSGIPKRERRSFRVGWGSHISRFYAHGWRARTCDCVWNMGDSRDLPPLQEHVISKYGHIQRKKKKTQQPTRRHLFWLGTLVVVGKICGTWCLVSDSVTNENRFGTPRPVLFTWFSAGGGPSSSSYPVPALWQSLCTSCRAGPGLVTRGNRTGMMWDPSELPGQRTAIPFVSDKSTKRFRTVQVRPQIKRNWELDLGWLMFGEWDLLWIDARELLMLSVVWLVLLLLWLLGALSVLEANKRSVLEKGKLLKYSVCWTNELYPFSWNTP